MHAPPCVLTIAGSDCSSGAGIQADLKTFSRLGTHGLTAITCVVAETPHHVVSIHPVPPAILQDQIRILLDTYPIAAIKTGMLYSKAHIVAITELLENRNIPLIIDPVMVATSGASLLHKDAIQAYFERLFPLATLVTPNMPEASVLLGYLVEFADQMEAAAQAISKKYNLSCLLKGGHLPANEERLDVLCHGGDIHRFTAATIDINNTHGTGCTLSAAITANLALGMSLVDAVSSAKQWVHDAIKTSFYWDTPDQQKVYCLNHLQR